MSAGENGSWQPVDPSEELHEGDLVKTYHCVQAPGLLDNEIIAKLSVEIGQLTGQMNAKTPDCMETEVINTEIIDGAGTVVEGDECEFLYVTTMRITEMRPEGACQDYNTGALGQAVVLALAAALVLGGISLVFYQAQKFISTDGGAEIGQNVSIAALLVAGGWAFTQFAGSEDDDE